VVALIFYLALFLMRVRWDLEICVSAFTESVLSYFYAFRMECATTNVSDLEKGEVRAVASMTAKDGGIECDEATLVINVWYEAEHQQPFRARLTSTSNGMSEVVTRYASNQDAVLSAVREWLRGLPNN
jgi:hypothetical protein